MKYVSLDMKKIIRFLSVIIIIAAVGLLGGGVLQDGEIKEGQKITDVEENIIGNTLSDVIVNYLNKQDIDQNKIAIYVQSLTSDESYILNPDTDFFAASVYKLPLAMIYYENAYKGKIDLSDSLQYLENHYKEGGPVAKDFKINSWIPISTLLHHMIVNSDNTAAHILFENLGGWLNYRELSAAYSQHELNASFYTYDNILTARYMNDVLSYLYEHQNIFSSLINDLYNAMPNSYLNLKIPLLTAQKYGDYGNAQNASGLVLDGEPYSIVIFTDLGSKGKEVIGEINYLCYMFFQESN